MVSVCRTEEFARCLRGLRDLKAKAIIQARIERVICGNPGDVRPVGAGVLELRIHRGPGDRVYFQQRGSTLDILLAGGEIAHRRKILNLLRVSLVTSWRMNDGDQDCTL